MRTLSLLAGLLLIVVDCSASWAADAFDPSDVNKILNGGDSCFEVSRPPFQSPDSHTILLNRCTGQTWQLVRTPLDGNNFTYRWMIITIGQGEAVLVHPYVPGAAK